jgi:hypothetical protein
MVMAAAAQPILAAADGLDEARTRFNEGPRWTNIAGWFPSGDGPGKSYALIVGVSRYQGFPSLASTAGDPERMRAFLLEKADFDHVQILTEDAVTRDRLRSLILDELPRIISEVAYPFRSAGSTSGMRRGRA